jgi:hypothetical protein
VADPLDPKTPFARHQRAFLTEIFDRGLCKDSALAARFAELGESGDRSTPTKWRSGERQAPLGMLPILLGHVDAPAEVLSLLARPHGLRVVPDGDLDTDERGLADRALEVGALAGDVQQTVRAALADGRITDEERALIHETAELAIRRLQELSAITAPRRKGAA